MTFILQDPENEDTQFLLETILESSIDATKGAAMFSFASSTGAKMLLCDDIFREFAARSSFDLVIGIDAVTNTEALAAISEATADFNGVNCKVFLHQRPMALFHPKVCWFGTDTRGMFISGSGNLTLGGLRSNWEAYASIEIDEHAIHTIEDTWNEWTRRHDGKLRNLADPEVIEKASQNNSWAKLGDTYLPTENDQEQQDEHNDSEVEQIDLTNEVLIAEIPRAANRWQQAGFDLHNYETFFGAMRGTQRRMIFQHVSSTGELGDVESRPSVAVASDNYRFELGAASGLPYPDTGRPIAVFIRVSVRTFRYALLMPTNLGYEKASEILEQQWQGGNRNMRRVRLSAQELFGLWPEFYLLERR